MRIERKAPMLTMASEGPPKTSSRPATEAVVAVQPAQQDTLLNRLRTGAIDVGTYLNRKVEQATAHLDGLAPRDLAEVRTMLRDRLENDATLVALVRVATAA